MAAYAFISSLSRFHLSLNGLVVRDGEECETMAEMTPKIVSCVAVWSLLTLSLQVDLVLLLGDKAATVSHNLFNRCSVILCMVVQQCGQNTFGTQKMQYLRGLLF